MLIKTQQKTVSQDHWFLVRSHWQGDEWPKCRGFSRISVVSQKEKLIAYCTTSLHLLKVKGGRGGWGGKMVIKNLPLSTRWELLLLFSRRLLQNKAGGSLQWRATSTIKQEYTTATTEPSNIVSCGNDRKKNSPSFRTGDKVRKLATFWLQLIKNSMCLPYLLYQRLLKEWNKWVCSWNIDMNL